MAGGEMQRLSHLDEHGRARMVDVGGKDVTHRRAVARGRLLMRPETLDLILSGRAPKGDVLAVARTAGIMAAKRTADLIPLCHPLPLTAVEVRFAGRRPEPGSDQPASLEIEAVVETVDRTGVEMEALTAVAVAGLTVYDMCKAVDRGMVLEAVRLTAKSGGRSGRFQREGEEPL
ncbi:MAG: cyclic pyranopterin monophosphate synthase MoaC [Thermaerobacter sp.]